MHRHDKFRPSRALAHIHINQGLAPLAIDCRPSGASCYNFSDHVPTRIAVKAGRYEGNLGLCAR
jgi:hypothetical protein